MSESSVTAIYGYEPVFQAPVQFVVVPALPMGTTDNQQSQFMYAASADVWSNAYNTPGTCDFAPLGELMLPMVLPSTGHVSTGSHKYRARNQTGMNQRSWQTWQGLGQDMRSRGMNARWREEHGMTEYDQAKGMRTKTKFRRSNVCADVGAPADCLVHEDDNSHVTIVLGSLPEMLCSESCLAAILEQSNLEKLVNLFSVVHHSDTSEAVVICKSEHAAQKVIRHFQSLKCGKSSQGITSRYCAEAGKRLLLSRLPPEEESREPTVNPESDFPKCPEAKTVESRVEKASSIVPLVLTEIALKKRWSEWDISDDEDDTQSTITGLSPCISESNEDEL